MDSFNYSYERYPYEIARQWFERGQKEEDNVFRFVSYWIVFNQMYNYGVNDYERTTETERIMDFCRKHVETLIDTVNFDADYLNEFKARPVISSHHTVDELDWRGGEDYIARKIYERLGRRNGERDNVLYNKCFNIAKEFVGLCDYRSNPKKRITLLFLTIYRIRCNLFHGMKNPQPKRDFRLISDSADILEECLPALMDEVFRIR